MLADCCEAEFHPKVAVMPFILGILAVLGAIVIFIIRANQAAQAARELGEVASEAKGFLRRRRWKSKTITDQIRAIEDPRLAAAVMMCAARQQRRRPERERSDRHSGPVNGDLGTCTGRLCGNVGPSALADP